MLLVHQSSKQANDHRPNRTGCVRTIELFEMDLGACRPYGWLERFDPNFTPNTTDFSHRRYAYQQQPQIGLWNLIQLANALARAELVQPVSWSPLPSLCCHVPAHLRIWKCKFAVSCSPQGSLHVVLAQQQSCRCLPHHDAIHVCQNCSCHMHGAMLFDNIAAALLSSWMVP